MDSVEGVHYLFDRYAFINQVLIEHFKKRKILSFDSDAKVCISFNPDTSKVDIYLGDQEGNILHSRPFGDAEDHPDFFMISSDSDQKAVKAAIKNVRVLYHPDRFENDPDSIKETAAQKRNLIEKSATILLDEDLRPLYGERLVEFYTKDPRLVSQSGAIIVPIGGDYDFFSLDSILSDEVPDTASFEAQVKQMVQFDDAQFEQAKSLFETIIDNDQIRSLYKDALTKKLIYLTLLEDAAWAKIGYGNKKSKTRGHVLHADSYAENVEAELSHIIEAELPQAVNMRNDALRIGTAYPPLLLTNQSGSGAESTGALAIMDEETIQKVLSKARENMEIRAEYVRDIAKQKQGVLEELVTLCDLKPLKQRNFNNAHHTIVLGQVREENEAPQFMLAYEFNAEASNLQVVENSFDLSGSTVEEALEKLSLPDTNVFLLLHNTEISDFNIEVVGAAEKLTEEWQEQRKLTSGASSDPAP